MPTQPPTPPPSSDPNDVRNLMRLNTDRDPAFRRTGPIAKSLPRRAGNAADPNDVFAHLRTNADVDPSLQHHGAAEDMARWKRKRMLYAAKVASGLAIFDAACIAFAAWFQWDVHVAVPTFAGVVIVTASTLWVAFVVNRK